VSAFWASAMRAVLAHPVVVAFVGGVGVGMLLERLHVIVSRSAERRM
jgi:hypothetical protein